MELSEVIDIGWLLSYASIHLSRGTNLLWVQRQGGWQSPTVLLSTWAFPPD